MRFAGRADCNESCSISSKEASLSNLKNARCLCRAEKTLEVIQRFYPMKFCSFLAPMRGDTDKLAGVFCCKPSMFKMVWSKFFDQIHTPLKTDQHHVAEAVIVERRQRCEESRERGALAGRQVASKSLRASPARFSSSVPFCGGGRPLVKVAS